MARDASYQPGVYREQGGDVLVVSTTAGRLNVETGAKIDVKSGATLEIDSGATFTNAATITNSGTATHSGTNTFTGTVTHSAALVNTLTAASTAQTLNGYGTSLIGSTATGALAYKLNRPGTAGARKTLVVRNSTGGLTVASATATAQVCKFHRTLSTLTFNANSDGMALDLVGETSTSWSIVGYSTAAGTYQCT